MAERFERMPNILVIGAAGVGKSTWLNDTFGAAFRTGRSAYSVTQECTEFTCIFNGARVRVWDCPGIFDGERTIEDWSTALEKSTKGCGFAQIFMVVNATTRPGTLDGLVTIGLRCLLQNFRIEKGVTVVFTHLDAAPQYYQANSRAEWV
jgi:GTPase Era involved in 16S rRNA processing